MPRPRDNRLAQKKGTAPSPPRTVQGHRGAARRADRLSMRWHRHIGETTARDSQVLGRSTRPLRRDGGGRRRRAAEATRPRNIEEFGETVVDALIDFSPSRTTRAVAICDAGNVEPSRARQPPRITTRPWGHRNAGEDDARGGQARPSGWATRGRVPVKKNDTSWPGPRRIQAHQARDAGVTVSPGRVAEAGGRVRWVERQRCHPTRRERQRPAFA